MNKVIPMKWMAAVVLVGAAMAAPAQATTYTASGACRPQAEADRLVGAKNPCLFWFSVSGSFLHVAQR